MTRERDALAETIAVSSSRDPLASSDCSPAAPARGPGRVLPEGTRLGRFIVLGPIGAGGFSVVYRAFDPRLNRVVAIKLLHPAAAGESASAERQERLLREAQALARVSHRNIIAVHDVGVHGDEVFLAMELVEGPTVLEWVRERQRRVRDIVEVFCEVCAGLAAAHEAGLVHRDVKPSNMVIARDGTVKVLDFGLARACDELEVAQTLPAPAVDPELSGATDRLASDITRAGTVLGTPAYMAPEQLQGERANPLADQYSLCVSLYQALHGVLPFTGDTPSEQRRAIIDAVVPQPPRASRVPRRLRAIVLRGMAATPEQRYASIPALLSDLRCYLDRRRRAGRYAALAAALAATVTAVAVPMLGQDASAMCEGAERHVARLWDRGDADAVRARFAATGKPHAAGTFERVDAGMNDYRERWIAAHTETCRATHVYGEQSEAALDARMACLDRQRAKVEQLVGILAGEAGGAALDRSAPALAQVTRELAECASDGDAAALAGLDAAGRVESDALRRAIDRVHVLKHTGRYADAQAEAAPLVARAARLGVPVLSADAHHATAMVESVSGDPARTEDLFRSALHEAARGRDAHRQARSWLALIRIVANHRGDAVRAEQLLFPASLAVETAGDEGQQLRWLLEASDVARVAGDYATSLARAEEARALLATLADPDPEDQAQVYKQVAMALTLLDRPREALPYVKREVQLRREALGERHPHAAYALTTLGTVLTAAGEYAEAAAQCARSVELLRESFPQGNFAVYLAQHELGVALTHLRRHDEAEAALRAARDGMRAQLGPTHEHALAAEIALATLAVRRGEPRRAEEQMVAVLAQLQASEGAPRSRVIAARRVLGEALVRQRRFGEAADAYRAAEAEALAIHDAGHREIGGIAVGLGRVALGEGKPRVALEQLRRARAILVAADAPAEQIVEAMALAAQAHHAAGEVAEARTVARQAARLAERAGLADLPALRTALAASAER